MKKILNLIITLLVVIAVVGSGAISYYCILDKTARDDLKQYRNLEKEKKLNENNIYYEAVEYEENRETEQETTEEAEEGIERDSNKIRVTFAENNYLKIRYYKDKEYKEEVTEFCDLEPNSCIYAFVSEKNNPYTNLYDFLEYRIYECNETGMKLLDWTVEEENMVFQIPMDYTGKELSVVPIGGYKNRELTLQNFYMDIEGNRHSLAGKWIIDKEETTKDTIEISPVIPYILSYEYDSDSYFFVSSRPSCRYQDNEDGIVIFEEADAKSDITNYSIELSPYITTQIAADIAWNYKINDSKLVSEKKKSRSIENLKYEDRIVVYTDRKTEFQYDKDKLTEPAEAQISNGYSYTFLVKEKNASFYFDPSEYSYSHGKILFKCRGRELVSGQYLGEGRQIEYEADNVEEGYWLPDGDHTIVVGSEGETKKALKEIKFYPKTPVQVYLTQPKAGGTITYFVDGTAVETPSVEVYAGTNIYMDFLAWEGWICNKKDHIFYTAGEEATQEIHVDSTDMEKIFTEHDNHKPNLSVVLDKSIGETLQVGIEASGYQETGIVYQDSAFKNTYTLDIGKIGTEAGILISMDHDSVQSGYAIRIKTTKTDINGNQSEEINYIQKLPVSELIELYPPEEIAKAVTYYKNVEILIDRVDINVYEPKIIDHATVSLLYADTQTAVNQGDILDEDREVIVTITPEEGYYITGTKKVSNDSYQDTLNYKKYLSEIDKIIEENPVKKIYTITLDENDLYGTVVYKLDGVPVTGEIKVREKQEILLEYQITDTNYEIETEGLLKFVKNKTEGAATIEISEEMDGNTIKREDYITVVKKGE